MQAINWGAVEAQEQQEFKRIVPGGYVCRIIDVKDVPEKEYLHVVLDVAEGEYANVGEKAEQATGNDWSYIKMYRSYKEKAQGMFKAFLVALEKSNKGFIADKFDGKEYKLKNLLVGIILREEEYVGRDKNGNDVKKTRCVVYSNVSADKIRMNDYKTPVLKELSADDKARVMSNYVPFSNNSVPVDDSECPF